MNKYQQAWWEQTRSDLETLKILRSCGANPCKELHYLQMAKENLGKAYFWRKWIASRKSYSSFEKFLQALNDRQE